MRDQLYKHVIHEDRCPHDETLLPVRATQLRAQSPILHSKLLPFPNAVEVAEQPRQAKKDLKK